MMIRLIKWIIRIVFAMLIWKNIGPLLSIFYFIICIPIDFVALFLCDRLAIHGFMEEKGEAARLKAVEHLIAYQRGFLDPDIPVPPIVTISQLILGPLSSIILPIIIGWIFLELF